MTAATEKVLHKGHSQLSGFPFYVIGGQNTPREGLFPSLFVCGAFSLIDMICLFSLDFLLFDTVVIFEQNSFHFQRKSKFCFSICKGKVN